MLPAVLRAETSATKDENHWILSLQFGELPAFRGVIGKLIVGEVSPWNNVSSHMKTTFLVVTGHLSHVTSVRQGNKERKKTKQDLQDSAHFAKIGLIPFSQVPSEVEASAFAAATS